jgi:hypothetical protein
MTNNHLNRFKESGRKRAFAWVSAVLFLGSALHAEETCPVEIKLLLSTPTQSVTSSLGFEKEAAFRVYFYDTNTLDLQAQGLIVRLRQGAVNDLTVKVRLPRGNRQADSSHLEKLFQCEIDQTGVGEDISFSIQRKYKALQVPETGNDLASLLTPEQKRLLQEARVSIDWPRVARIASINSTTWQSRSQTPFRKLALELWQWPTGNTLELSTKAEPGAGPAVYEELQRLVKLKNLSLEARQGTKTSMVLETLTHHPSPPE